MKHERRRRRSIHRLEAARLYLEAARKRAQAHAVAFGGVDGLVIAGAGPEETVDVLGVAGAEPPCDLLDSEEPVHRAELELQGAMYRLTSLGGAAIPTEEAMAALGRILFS